jgi:hypothetical protein
MDATMLAIEAGVLVSRLEWIQKRRNDCSLRMKNIIMKAKKRQKRRLLAAGLRKVR